jgi:hypothetical protein
MTAVGSVHGMRRITRTALRPRRSDEADSASNNPTPNSSVTESNVKRTVTHRLLPNLESVMIRAKFSRPANCDANPVSRFLWKKLRPIVRSTGYTTIASSNTAAGTNHESSRTKDRDGFFTPQSSTAIGLVSRLLNASSGATRPVNAALSHRWRMSDAWAYSGIAGRILADSRIGVNSGGNILRRAGILPILDWIFTSCSRLVRYCTTCQAASGLRVNFEIANPHPPKVAALR